MKDGFATILYRESHDSPLKQMEIPIEEFFWDDPDEDQIHIRTPFLHDQLHLYLPEEALPVATIELEVQIGEEFVTARSVYWDNGRSRVFEQELKDDTNEIFYLRFITTYFEIDGVPYRETIRFHKKKGHFIPFGHVLYKNAEGHEPPEVVFKPPIK